MADYYPLLARALDSMPDRSPALRKAVYDRARAALISQLRSLEPPLAESDIALESSALEHAITRLEVDHGSDPVPADDPAPPPEPASRDDLPEPIAPAPAERIEPNLPPATPPDLGVPVSAAPPPGDPVPEPPASEDAAPVVRIQPRKAKVAAAAPAVESPATPPVFLPDPAPQADAAEPVDPAAVDPSALPADAANGRQRPRIDVVSPRGSRSRLLRNIFVGSVLVVVMGLIAVAAFLLRDKPNEFPQNAAETQDGPAPGADSKYADRVGGDPAAPPTAERVAPTSGQAAPVKSPPQPDVAVAQRAVLYEENTAAGANAPPTAVQGHAVWRLEAVNGEQGQPLQTAVRATVEFPEAGLTLLLTLRRNLDATLPASHTIELSFTNTSTTGAKRGVQDIGLLSGKDEESARGSPVSGLPVRVRDNLFLIGLSSLRNDIDRNTDLLLHKNWFDLAVKFASGQRGIMTFEKGSSGTQVMQSAFDEWRR